MGSTPGHCFMLEASWPAPSQARLTWLGRPSCEGSHDAPLLCFLGLFQSRGGHHPLLADEVGSSSGPGKEGAQTASLCQRGSTWSLLLAGPTSAPPPSRLLSRSLLHPTPREVDQCQRVQTVCVPARALACVQAPTDVCLAASEDLLTRAPACVGPLLRAHMGSLLPAAGLLLRGSRPP